MMSWSMLCFKRGPLPVASRLITVLESNEQPDENDLTPVDRTEKERCKGCRDAESDRENCG